MYILVIMIIILLLVEHDSFHSLLCVDLKRKKKRKKGKKKKDKKKKIKGKKQNEKKTNTKKNQPKKPPTIPCSPAALPAVTLSSSEPFPSAAAAAGTDRSVGAVGPRVPSGAAPARLLPGLFFSGFSFFFLIWTRREHCRARPGRQEDAKKHKGAL